MKQGRFSEAESSSDQEILL